MFFDVLSVKIFNQIFLGYYCTRSVVDGLLYKGKDGEVLMKPF